MTAVGETLLGKSFEKNFGGKGANQAVQCQRLGISTAFIGRVGADSYGSEYIANFQKEGIATTFFRQVEGATSGIASIWVDGNGNNSIIIVPGANLHQNPDQLKSNLSSFPLTKVMVFQNEISEDATFTGLKLARELNILSIFNPAPVSKGCAQMVPFTDILCVNEVELAILSEKTVIFEESSIREACQALLELGCKEVVVTFGSKGAYLVNQSTFRHFPAPDVKAVDTVGAGDSFIGKFNRFDRSSIDTHF